MRDEENYLEQEGHSFFGGRSIEWSVASGGP